MATPIRLRVFKAGVEVDCKDFDCSIIKIGRLSAAQLCLDDDKVSRIHAVIDVAVDGTFSIIDMGSVEGTFVNNKRINRGDLKFGDEIRLGSTLIHVEDAAIEAQALPLAQQPILSSTLPMRAAVEEVDFPEVDVVSLPGAGSGAVVSAVAREAENGVAVSAVNVATPLTVPVEVSGAAGLMQPVVERRVAKPAEAKPAEHRPRRGSAGGGKPLGLAIRVLWGDQPLESHYFGASEQARFVVGAVGGVDFPMRDLLFPGRKFEVVSFDKGHASLKFTDRMEGELHESGKAPLALSAAIHSKLATPGEGEGAYSIDLGDSDFMWIGLGDNIVLEAHMDTAPKPAWVPFLNRIDFAALNIFLVIALLGSLSIISALNMSKRGVDLLDELSANDARLVKLIEQSPDIQKNIQRKFENIQKANAGEAAARARGDEGDMGNRRVVQKDGQSTPQGDPNDSNRQRKVLETLIGGAGRGGGAGATALGHGRGGEARAALGGLTGSRYGDAAGAGGLGVRGVGSGGGGDSLSSIGIGGAQTKGGASFGTGSSPGLTGRPKNEVPDIFGGDASVEGNIDGELIRQVIRRNSSKIRACYEEQLIRYPQLAGRVSIRFVIDSEGLVNSSRVHYSGMAPKNSEIGNCVATKIRILEFPRPKGGGTAQVTYPFIFKPTG